MPATQAFQQSLRPPCLQHCKHVGERRTQLPSLTSGLQQRSSHRTRYDRQHVLTCQAKKGFGAGGTKKSKKRHLGPELQEEDPAWLRVGRLADFKSGKQTRAVILPDNSAIVLYRTTDDEVYCSDAQSTAYKFPMIDANVIEREDGPAVEVPLDGTVYDLETGKVLVWCPKNNPLRFVLGSLKSTADRQPLKMYPARVNSYGQIFAKLSPN